MENKIVERVVLERKRCLEEKLFCAKKKDEILEIKVKDKNGNRLTEDEQVRKR